MADGYFGKEKMVTILDPGIATRNSGDHVISNAVEDQLFRLFPDHFVSTVPTHESMGPRSHRLIMQSEYAFVGGSNILTSSMFGDRQWRIGVRDLPFVKKLILIGVGWREYEKAPSSYTKKLLQKLLSRDHVHSVRDSHTQQLLHDVGFDNVEMTSCVTMWNLSPEHLATVPSKKGKAVVTTINMEKSTPRDIEITKLLLREYGKVFIWPQGLNDREFIERTYPSEVQVIGASLKAYDHLLETEPGIDYCGNRLHGGIRALQKGKRALIFSIDNRATEIARDTGLTCVPRDTGDDEIVAILNRESKISLNLPNDAINRWRASFA